MIKKIEKIVNIFFKGMSYLMFLLLMVIWIFNPDKINEITTNELMLICTIIIISMLNKDE